MFEEPNMNPKDDTHPIETFPELLSPEAAAPIAPSFSRWQKLIGALSLMAALGLTVASILLMISPADVVVIAVTHTPDFDDQTTSPHTDAALDEHHSEETVITTDEQGRHWAVLSEAARNSLLLTPVAQQPYPEPLQIASDGISPFTIIPDRPRNTMMRYTIQRNDTIYEIAHRFGLSQETIAWSNDRRQIWTLIPGDELNIPPVDGVYVQTVGNATLREIINQYQVTDPAVVLESEVNNLPGIGADSVPPSGTWIFIPGGVAEEVNWAPPIVQSTGTSGTPGSGGGDPDLVGFQLGDPGSCGLLPRGQGTAWSNPMTFGSYTITRGFASWHQGIDLAAGTGTPVYAANGGRVIFAGRNNWGYGLAVVISHGPFTTLYGHLSVINVSCGQVVNSGQVIAGVGSTGNSSGPHLHFEIMYNGVRSDPAATLSF